MKICLKCGVGYAAEYMVNSGVCIHCRANTHDPAEVLVNGKRAPVDESGDKYDTGKPRMDLIPFEALEEIAKVLTYGAKKYSPHNWKMVDDARARYEAALLRHYAAYQRGETNDPESGLRHLAHLGCNALFLIWIDSQGRNMNCS